MKQQFKKKLILLRNRWALSNSIKVSRDGSAKIFGNLLHTKISVKGNSTIAIGKGCRLRNATLLIRGNNNKLVLEEGVLFIGRIELFGDNNLLHIGKFTNINGADFIVHNGTKVEIGDRCLFSSNIDIRTTDSHKIFNADGEHINTDRDIFIGEHVWIGRMVSVLKGVKIGAGSVIGAMSVVSGTIPNNVIAVGIPARPIKHGVSWQQ